MQAQPPNLALVPTGRCAGQPGSGRRNRSMTGDDVKVILASSVGTVFE